MNLKDNIIKEFLRNVYLISGSACGGKTTISRLLAEKYGFYLYDMDAQYPRHRAMASKADQPDTCYHMKDFHEQWTRPIEEQARWSLSSIREQTDMVICDLIALSKDRIVVGDVLHADVIRDTLVNADQSVLLVVDPSAIRKQYFNGPEKESFYRFVARQELSELYFENIFRSLELVNESERKVMEESGLPLLDRAQYDTKEKMLAAVEELFGLTGSVMARREDIVIHKLTPDTPLYRLATDYIDHSDWVAGPHIASLLREKKYTDWETAFAAVQKGKIIGYCTFAKTDYYPDNRYAPWISGIYVDPSARGNRLSALLVEGAERYAKSCGFSRAYIPSDMTGFYERYGYRLIDRLVNFGGDTDNIFAKDL